MYFWHSAWWREGVLRATVGAGQRGGQAAHPESASAAWGLQRTSDLCVCI